VAAERRTFQVESFDITAIPTAAYSYIKLDNMIAPRFVFSWDKRANVTTNLFGNARALHSTTSR
jgi:hypothetical protein